MSTLALIIILFLSGGIYVVHGYEAASTQSAEATATAQASLRNPYAPYGGTLVLNDPLTNGSRGYDWETGSDGVGSCAFKGGALHVSIAKQRYFEYCPARGITVSNFAYQVQMTLLKGDRGGFVFRCSDTDGYYFSVGSNGSYALATFGSSFYHVLLTGSLSPIKLKQSVIMAVVARGTTLTLYLNYHKIGSVSDRTLSSGKVSVAAEDVNNATEVAFSSAKVWKW